jgi:phage host-nuclease inhibitor protein Gam
MQTDTTNFLDELLADAELHEDKQTEAHYDLVIMEIARLEAVIAKNIEIVQMEMVIIKEWMINKNAVLTERCELLKRKLENYIKESGNKTIDLPHGILKIRKMPDKVEITDVELFLKNARAEMLNVIPEQIKPDLNKIKAFMKVSNKVPLGVSVIEGKEEFKLIIHNQGSAIT